MSLTRFWEQKRLLQAYDNNNSVNDSSSSSRSRNAKAGDFVDVHVTVD